MRRAVLAIVALFAVAVAAAPASAINVPGCGDFLIFSKGNINFEGGATDISGDVLSQNGRIIIGAQNKIHGTVTANEIIVGNGAVVDECVANTITLLGTGTCTTTTTPRPANASCTGSFPPPGITITPLAGFPNPCSPGTNFIASAAAPQPKTLAAGCYNSVRVEPNATLQLTAGGVYFIKGELRVRNSGQLLGDAANHPVINLAGALNTEAFAALKNLDVLSSNTSGGAIQPQVNNILDDVLIATLGNNHVHGGTQLQNGTELVAATFLDIEPITSPLNPTQCVCANGFANPTAPPGQEAIFTAARLCNP